LACANAYFAQQAATTPAANSTTRRANLSPCCLIRAAERPWVRSCLRSIEDLKAEVGHETPDDTIGTAVVKYTNEMTATLIGADFSITPITDERQLVTGVGDTRWKWWVEPKRSGLLHLSLRLTAHIEYSTPGSRAVTYRAPRTIKTFERTLTIRAIPESNSDKVLGFVGDNWQWLFTVLILPAGLWALRGWRTRKHPPATPPTGHQWPDGHEEEDLGRRPRRAT
jgi:hypothetical protein